MKDKDPRLVELRHKAYREIFRSLFFKGDINLTEARKFLDEFNHQHNSDLNAFDMFMCTINIEGGQMLPVEPGNIPLIAARLAVKDCKVDLLNPKKREEHEVLRIEKDIAEAAIKALEA